MAMKTCRVIIFCIILLLLEVPAAATYTGTLTSSIRTSKEQSNDRSLSNRFATWIVFIFSQCLTRHAGNLVVVAGNLSEKISSQILRSANMTVMLVTKMTATVDHTSDARFWTSGTFLIAAKSQPILRQLIHQLSFSGRWRWSAFFIIMNEKPEKSGCRNARSYLSTAWTCGLISAVYLCKDRNVPRKLILYAYNPFKDEAPRPVWKTVGTYGGRNGHPWTMFRHELDSRNFKVDMNCKNLFFKKMDNLNGYPVRVNFGLHSPTLVFPVRKASGLEKYAGEDGWLAQALWGHLNATIIEVPHTGVSRIGLTDDRDSHNGMLADIISGRVDTSLNQRYVQAPVSGLGSTYPHISAGYCFLTRSKGVVQLWRSLLRNTNGQVTALILGSSWALILLIDSMTDNAFASAVVLSGSAYRFSVRLLILGTLTQFGIACGIFQGQIASLVLRPRKYDNIDTLDELERSGLQLHGYIGLKKFLTRPKLRSKFNSTQIESECIKMALNGTAVACAGTCMSLLMISMQHENLHIAEQPILQYYSHYVSRVSWPLRARINKLIGRMVSVGLPTIWRDRTIWSMKMKMFSAKGVDLNESCLIQLADLEVGLWALLGGLLSAGLVLFIEIAVFRWRSKRRVTVLIN